MMRLTGLLRHAPSATDAIGGAALLAGVGVSAGWLLRLPALIPYGALGPAPVLMAAVCIALTGASLLAARRDGRLPAIGRAAAPLLAVVAGLSLAQAVLDLDLGLDLAPLHGWLKDGNPFPGRMSPIAAAGFAAGAAALLLLDRPQGRIGALALELLVFAQIVVGIVGVLSNWLSIEALYGWHGWAPMPASVAIAIVLLGVAGWMRTRALEPDQARLQREEWNLTIVAGEILAVIALIAGLGGFAVLQRSIEASFADSLEDNLTDRIRSFDNTLRDAMQDNAMIADRPGIARAIATLEGGEDGAARQDLQRAAEAMLPFGYSEVAYQDH